MCHIESETAACHIVGKGRCVVCPAFEAANHCKSRNPRKGVVAQTLHYRRVGVVFAEGAEGEDSGAPYGGYRKPQGLGSKKTVYPLGGEYVVTTKECHEVEDGAIEINESLCIYGLVELCLGHTPHHKQQCHKE